MPPEQLRSHLALALVPGLGPKLTRAVLERFGSPERARLATAAELETIPLIGAKLASKLAQGFRNVDVAAEWKRIQDHRIELRIRGDADYPARLETIESSPSLIYYRGSLPAQEPNAIGIVGSRSCTSYGRRMAEQIAAGLVRAGWTVISGLARGIDAHAHRGALDAEGRTIAVLAGGLSEIYPPEHDELAEEIVRNGAILTETPMTVPPQPGMFPARNRIISALSRAIVVVEANERSGALITATHAAEQGREVFAVPGNADSAASAGCLELIRKGARLIRSTADLLEDLRGIAPPDPIPKRVRTPSAPIANLFEPPPQPPPMEPDQKAVWEALGDPRHADVLSRELNKPMAELARLLMGMELKKLIRRLPGNSYERRGP